MFSLDHSSTFDALAFVQSGKQNKRFMTFTSNHEYAIIAEMTTFIFVYKKRTQGQHKSVHQLVELEKGEEVMGLQILNNNQFAILTKKNLIFYQLK